MEPPKSHPEIPSTGLKLNELDINSLLGICDHVNFGSLINLADTNTEFRQLITDRYMIPIFRIHEQVISFEKQDIVMYIPDDTIAIGKVHTILRFLRIFGHLITRVKLSGSQFEEKQTALITRYIDEYCAINLVELDLIDAGEYLISNAERIFEKARKVHLRNVKQLENIQIHRIYPNINELSFATDSKLAASPLYHLQYTQHFGNSLISLAQLRTLSLHGLPTFDLVSVISAKMPQLETLSIAYYVNNFVVPANQITHFNKVKTLKISVLEHNESHTINSLPLKFDQLDNLEIFSSLLHNVPINLIVENVGLRTLSLPTTLRMDEFWPVFDQIQSTHMNLSELTVVWNQLSDARTVKLMTDFQQFNKITFRVNDLSDTRIHLSTLLALVPLEWQVDRVIQFSAGINYKYDVTVIREKKA